MKVQEIAAQSVPQFSKRDKSYLSSEGVFDDMLKYKFDYNSFSSVINEREKYPVNRNLLNEVLTDQYKNENTSPLTQFHINKLKENNCFTVITAHQPSLFTGPLYYVFKILSTIRLCQKLEHDHLGNTFVPVFIIGSEDHDFEEINHLNIYGKRVEWKTNQIGSVGQFLLDGLQESFDDLNSILGKKHNITDLVADMQNMINSSNNYNEFSFKLTKRLFDRFGLVVIRMSDERLKSAFTPVVEEEIFNTPSKTLVEASQEEIIAKGFDKQAFARDINFFYVSKNGRNRIEKTNDGYQIVDTDLHFSEAEMKDEILKAPTRFSPNVIIRPLYQEFTLPNLAYIGGGGELAYWMERKSQFEHFNISFPLLIRRNSAVIIPQKPLQQAKDLGIDIPDLLKEEHLLVQQYLEASENPDFNLDQLKDDIEESFKKAEVTIQAIDNTLVKTAASEKVKAIKSVEHLESKLKKSLKQKEEVNINRLKKVRSKLLPSGLQERHDNIFEYIAKDGEQLLDQLIPHFDPFDKNLKVFITPR